jgi:hypothetical protein
VKVARVSIVIVMAVSLFALTACAAGPQGAKGATGQRGSAGVTGHAGANGAAGPAGSTGPAGSSGAAGASGLKGATGATGQAGANGSNGAPGIAGVPGVAGTPGATGPAAVAQYANLFNLYAQLVAPETDIIFTNNGVMTSDFAHIPFTPDLTIAAAGDYAVWFTVAANEPNQFSIFDNGLVVDGSIFGSGAGTQQNSGMVIVRANAGDILTLRNHSSTTTVTLGVFTGGTAVTTSASMIIEKLG